MKTLPTELIVELRTWYEDIECSVDNAVAEGDSREFPASAMFATLQAILKKHWPEETEIERKLQIHNIKPNK